MDGWKIREGSMDSVTSLVVLSIHVPSTSGYRRRPWQLPFSSIHQSTAAARRHIITVLPSSILTSIPQQPQLLLPLCTTTYIHTTPRRFLPHFSSTLTYLPAYDLRPHSFIHTFPLHNTPEQRFTALPPHHPRPYTINSAAQRTCFYPYIPTVLPSRTVPSRSHTSAYIRFNPTFTTSTSPPTHLPHFTPPRTIIHNGGRNEAVRPVRYVMFPRSN